MLAHVLMVLAGLVLLPLGAEGLVRGSTGIALRLGVTALVIGLTVVAFGTGSPELAVSVQAATQGSSGIALGSVIGSNISNIALVLGLAAMVRPLRVRSEIVRREVPIMIGASLALLVMLLDGRLSRFDGIVLALSAIIYTVLAYVAARRGESDSVEDEFEQAYEPSHSAFFEVVLMLVGLGVLITGAQLLLSGAVHIAQALGVSQVVVGLTVVAIGTSLPELATSVTSAVRGEADVAFGNVVGSNVLNILAVLGTAAIVSPFRAQGLGTVDLLVFILSAVALLPLLRRGWVLDRWEGALLLTGYGAYLAILVVNA